MPTDPPIVYLLHGEDDFSIAQFVKEMEGKMGDPTIAVLNINRLDGGRCSLDELRTAVFAQPFMSSRRLVIVSQLLSRINSPQIQSEFVELLDEIPATTALVLIENKLLKDEYWFIKWATSVKDRVYVNGFRTPKGVEMVQWIQRSVKQEGGKITRQAAFMLAGYIGDDLWLAKHEIDKLINYTNNERTIDEDDVSQVALSIPQGNIFALVDALGALNKRQAMATLKILLEDQDPVYVFVMIVRQIRLVLLAKEIISQGGDQMNVSKRLELHPYVAGKVTNQAVNFSLEMLEDSYKKLLGIDQAVKSGKEELDVALESFVAGIGQ